MNIIVIPARGGSKGLPRKNLKILDGLPLVVRAALISREAWNVDDVFVSTEDAEIKAVCHAYGVDVLDRPAGLATDEASTDAVIEHALNNLACDVLGLVQCTAPLMMTADVEQVIELVEKGADSAFAACKWHGFLWAADGSGINHDGKKRLRRQDAPVEYLEAGSVYAVNPKIFKQEKTRFCGRPVIVEVDRARVFEIDDATDFEIVERLIT